MINKKASIEALKGMESYELIKIIDEDYYRVMIACSPEEMNDGIDKIITELVTVQEGCGLAERYDLAIVCRTKLNELVEQMSVKDMLY
jgi:hypothetical protein